MSIFDDIKKGVDHATGTVKDAAEGAVDTVTGGHGNPVQDAVKSVKDQVLDQLKEPVDQIEDEIRKLGKDAVKEVEEAAKNAVRAAIREIEKGVLNKAIDMIQAVVPSSVKIKLGPVALDVGKVNDRIDQVQHWARAGIPSGVGGARQMIEAIAPTSCTVDLSAYLVTPLGLEMTWSTAEFLDRLEDIWSRL